MFTPCGHDQASELRPLRTATSRQTFDGRLALDSDRQEGADCLARAPARPPFEHPVFQDSADAVGEGFGHAAARPRALFSGLPVRLRRKRNPCHRRGAPRSAWGHDRSRPARRRRYLLSPPTSARGRPLPRVVSIGRVAVPVVEPVPRRTLVATRSGVGNSPRCEAAFQPARSRHEVFVGRRRRGGREMPWNASGNPQKDFSGGTRPSAPNGERNSENCPVGLASAASPHSFGPNVNWYATYP